MNPDRFVKREQYLAKLRKNRDDTDFVKVITGVRRCGKSVLMKQFIDELKTTGISDSNIIYINLESNKSKKFTEEGTLSEFLYGNIPSSGKSYLFIDEIQHVPKWQTLIDSLQVDKKECDIYITGSNAKLLSGELATYLTGRCVEIKMLPLSFKEYFQLHGGEKHERFDSYVRYGSFPAIGPDWDEQTLYDHLEGLFHTIAVKDIMNRSNKDLSEKKLCKLVTFVMDSAGMEISCDAIAKGLGISNATAESYLSLLEEAFVIYRAEKYDIKGKKILNSPAKYYPVDTGMRNSMVGFTSENIGRMLETIVFLELLRRGYVVQIGRCGNREVDFVAKRFGKTEYFQVTKNVTESDREREFGSLLEIKDNHPKTVLSMDSIAADSEDGIRHMNIIDWLLDRCP